MVCWYVWSPPNSKTPMANQELSAAAARVQRAVAAKGFDFEVRELPDSTRTAAQAAQAVGCSVAEIAKSLVFKASESGRAVLVITSGANRVDTQKLAALLGEKIGKADADFVRARTGFAIGGVPPVGHAGHLQTFIDEDLLRLETIWAAAGTPNALIALPSDALERLTGGAIANVKAG